MNTAEVFIAQSYGWGQEAQVDWYEAWADLAGELRGRLRCNEPVGGGEEGAVRVA